MKKSKIASLALGLGFLFSAATNSLAGTGKTTGGLDVTYNTAVYGYNLCAGTYVNTAVDMITAKLELAGKSIAYKENTHATSAETSVGVGTASYSGTASHKVLDGTKGNFYTQYSVSR